MCSLKLGVHESNARVFFWLRSQWIFSIHYPTQNSLLRLLTLLPNRRPFRISSINNHPSDLYMALVETSTALTLPEVKTGLVEWSWQNKYGVITETPIPKPGESLHCRPVGTDAYDAVKIIAANADGSYDFQIGTKVYRNVRNDGLYGFRETPEGQGNQFLLLEAHCLEVKPYAAEGFGKDGTVAIGRNTVWFELWERVWFKRRMSIPISR